MKISLIEKNEKDHFDLHASDYDTNYNYVEPFTKYKIEKKFKDLVKFIRSNYGETPIKILEIGCGTGEYTKKIAQKFPRSMVVAIDISPEILKFAERKCKLLKNTSFICKSVYDTKFANNSFDIIVGFYILHHINTQKFSKEAYRVLKPAGKLYFYEPNILNPIVYFIKSNKWLKKRLGDSPDEWAINPVTIGKDLKGFEALEISTSEFVWPVKFLSFKNMVALDVVLGYLRKVPLIKYLGGSTRLSFIKK